MQLSKVQCRFRMIWLVDQNIRMFWKVSRRHCGMTTEENLMFTSTAHAHMALLPTCQTWMFSLISTRMAVSCTISVSFTHFSFLDLLANNFYDNFYSFDEKSELLDDIYCSLEDRRNWKVNVYLPDFKVPLIRAKYIPWNMNCKCFPQIWSP